MVESIRPVRFAIPGFPDSDHILYSVSKVLESLRQLLPVDRPDRHLALEEPIVHHRAPFLILALHHVGDDRMSMELGVEVAGRIVAEGCGQYLLAAGPDEGVGPWRTIRVSTVSRLLSETAF